MDQELISDLMPILSLFILIVIIVAAIKFTVWIFKHIGYIILVIIILILLLKLATHFELIIIE